MEGAHGWGRGVNGWQGVLHGREGARKDKGRQGCQNGRPTVKITIWTSASVVRMSAHVSVYSRGCVFTPRWVFTVRADDKRRVSASAWAWIPAGPDPHGRGADVVARPTSAGRHGPAPAHLRRYAKDMRCKDTSPRGHGAASARTRF
jgi:hypothetical protein